MKNLLVITLLFFSIGAMAEENYRCKFVKICEGLSDEANCSGRVNIEYLSLKVDEGWFSNKLIYQGKDWSKNTEFGENILHWGTYSDGGTFGGESSKTKFSKYSTQYEFDKNSLVLRAYKSYKEAQDGQVNPLVNYNYAEVVHLCEKTN